MKRCILILIAILVSVIPVPAFAGVTEAVAILTRSAIAQELSGKAEGWFMSACTGLSRYNIASAKGGPASGWRNDIVKKLKEKLAREFPEIARKVVNSTIFANIAGKDAQAIAEKIVTTFTVSFNEQIDSYAAQIYNTAISQIEDKLKVQFGSINLDATNVRGSIASVIDLKNVDWAMTEAFSKVLGESTAIGIRERIKDVYNGEIPPEVKKYLEMGPDKFDEYADKIKENLPGAKLDDMKDKFFHMPIFTIPNGAYIGILAVSAIKHFAAAYSGPVVNMYEIKRGLEVTRFMVWQAKNKEGLSLDLKSFLDATKLLTDLGGVGSLYNMAVDRLKKIEEMADKVDGLVAGGLDKVSGELRSAVQGIEDELKKIQNELTSPVIDQIKKTDAAVEGIKDKVLAEIPENFHGIPANYEDFKDQFGIDEKYLGAFGENSIWDLLQHTPNHNPSIHNPLDPVLLHNGEFLVRTIDLFVPAPKGDFEFTRIYRSRAAFKGVMGHNWMHNYQERLVFDGAKMIHINATGFKNVSPKIERDGEEYVIKKDEEETRFSAEGRMLSKNGLSFVYDDSSRLKTISDSQSREYQFIYNDSRLLAKVIDFSGRTITLTYDENADLTAVTGPSSFDYPEGKTRRYAYSDHKMTRIMDPKGNIYLRLVYGVTSQDMNRVVVQQYGETNPRMTIRYAYLKPAYLLRFTGDGLTPVDLVTLADGRGVVHEFQHNANGNMLTEKIDGTILHAYKYDADGDIVEELGRGGRSYVIPAPAFAGVNSGGGDKLEYDEVGNITKVISPSGFVREFTVNSLNQVLAEDNKKYVYDKNDNIAEIILTDGKKEYRTIYEYDDLDNLIKLSREISKDNFAVTSWSYDPDGLVTQEVGPMGEVEKNYYNKFGDLIKIVKAPGTKDEQVVELEYNEYGEIVKAIDPMGNEIGSRSKVQDPGIKEASGNYIEYKHDSDGFLSSTEVHEKEGAVIKTTFEHDPSGKMTAMVDNYGNTIRFEYDGFGSLIKKILPDGNSTEYSYDGLGRMIASKNPDISFALDKSGRLTAITDAEGKTTKYSYDILGRLVNEAFPDGTAKAYAYDKNDNVIYYKDKMGREFVREYDPSGNLAIVKLAGSQEPLQSFAYDEKNRLIYAKDGENETFYKYDADSNIIGEHMNGRWASALFGENGKVDAIRYPSEKMIYNIYDEIGRLTDVSVGEKRVYSQNVKGIDRVDRKRFFNGIYDEIKIDLIGRITEEDWKKDGTILDQIKRQYYSDGLIKEVERQALGKSEFSYDQQNRLTIDTEAAAQARHKYNFDPLGRLASVETLDGRQIASYEYDTQNRRIKKHIGEDTIEYFYFGNLLVEEKNSAGWKLYVYAGHKPIYMEDGGQKYFLHTDELDSLIAVSDESGAIIKKNAVEPYGSDLPEIYGGGHLDRETGLYYFLNRYYDPETRKFITEDPIGYKNKFYEAPFGVVNGSRFRSKDYIGMDTRRSFSPQTFTFGSKAEVVLPEMDLYQYANGNPVNFNDPLGLRVTLTRNGNNIDLNWTIETYGPYASDGMNQQIQRSIEDYFNGTFGKYTVNATADIKLRKNGVVNSERHRMNIGNVGGSKMDCLGCSTINLYVNEGEMSGGFYVQDADFDRTISHELGHTLGMQDHYDENKIPIKGWEENLMACLSPTCLLDERNIEEMLNAFNSGDVNIGMDRYKSSQYANRLRDERDDQKAPIDYK